MPGTTSTRWLISCVSVIALLAGCGGAPGTTGPDDEPPTGTTTGPTEPATETFTEPPTEDPDETEDPDGGGDEEVAVNLPGLPIGGFHEVDPTDPTLRCVVINWSGPPDLVPPEVNLEINSVTVEPASAYTWSADGCGAFGPCLDSPGVFDSGGQCGVRVDQVAAAPDGLGVLSVTDGTITCAPDAAAVCTEFAEAVEASPDDVDWDDALEQWVSTNDEDTTTGPTSDSDPTDNGDPTGETDSTDDSDPSSDVSGSTG